MPEIFFSFKGFPNISEHEITALIDIIIDLFETVPYKLGFVFGNKLTTLNLLSFLTEMLLEGSQTFSIDVLAICCLYLDVVELGRSK